MPTLAAAAESCLQSFHSRHRRRSYQSPVPPPPLLFCPPLRRWLCFRPFLEPLQPPRGCDEEEAAQVPEAQVLAEEAATTVAVSV